MREPRCLARAFLVIAGLAGVAGCNRHHEPGGGPAASKRGIFQDATPAAGVHFVHESGVVKALHPNLLQTTGSGCAFWDYDGDGWLDLYLVDSLHRPGGGNRLYHNRGNGTFEDMTDRAGVRGHGYGMGCVVGDYDNDGRPDLYVTNYGSNILYRNEGDGRFRDVTREAGAAAGGWSTAAAFFDADGNGTLDLYVGRYVRFNEKSKQFCETAGVEGQCNPSEYTAEPDLLLLNRGNGRFVDGTREAGIRDPNGRALGVLVDDYDADGRPDLFVANDGSACYLFHNEGGGRFVERGVPSGVAYGMGGLAEASMGCDWGDYDGDGRPDLLVGTFQGQMESLYRNLDNGVFLWSTPESGLAGPTTRTLTFGCGFFDYNNDGRLDIALANGHVHPLIESVDPDAPYHQPRQLFENLGGGKFRDAASDAGPDYVAPSVGRGLAFGDFDNDGRVDLLVSNNDLPAVLLRNVVATGNHWLGVALSNDKGEAARLGARVTVTAGKEHWTRVQRVAYSFAGANDPRVHFGLGGHSGPVEVTVRWPVGKQTTLSVPGVDRYVSISPSGIKPR